MISGTEELINDKIYLILIEDGVLIISWQPGEDEQNEIEEVVETKI